MGRGRAPCCAKVGLNKGSWTPEEDMRLISYIHKYGHGNWRALPKLAGLLRCGKSCRLRWINYLRPDIKRGNFTKEEEDTIIKLHELLGNKWSKIASCLPGRTDNEIKNVWNTHLKKRLGPAKARKQSGSFPDEKKPEEPPSSPSSITTASISCSDHEGNNHNNKESKGKKRITDANSVAIDQEEEQEIDKIEIPVIEPNMDLWDILEDTPNDLLIELPEMSIEPEIWSVIDEGFEMASYSGSASKEKDESERWLAYLEKELDLWGESSTTTSTSNTNPNNTSTTTSREACNFVTADVEGAGDPLMSYFHAQDSSPSPLDLLY